MKIQDITSYLETLAPLAYQEDYDNAGLLTGNADKRIDSALVCIDCTEKVVDEALVRRCGLIISHHPLIFKGIKQLTGADHVQRTLIKAVKHDLAIYAIHTNLDHVHNGVNSRICQKLGLIQCEVLRPKTGLLHKLFTFCPVSHAGQVRQALFETGAGVIGDYHECSFNVQGTGTFRGTESTAPFVGKKEKQELVPEMKIETIYPVHIEKQVIEALLGAHPYEEVAYDMVAIENSNPRVGAGMIGRLARPERVRDFLFRLKKSMKVSCIKFTAPVKRTISVVAVCGGAGGYMLDDAKEHGADVFVTSDVRYHQFFNADTKIILADIGHYESEQFTKELIRDLILKKFPNFALHLAKTNTNPVHYL